jgi:gamma-glutamylcyclotransferase (GGCT)/AIG2-like uncharacterized protein YtfP
MLVSLGRYPALIDGRGTVRGEVFTFDDLAAALDILDDVEDFNAADPDNSLYLRVARPITMDGGAIRIAWLYRYNGATAGLPVLSGGVWPGRAG